MPSCQMLRRVSGAAPIKQAAEEDPPKAAVWRSCAILPDAVAIGHVVDVEEDITLSLLLTICISREMTP